MEQYHKIMTFFSYLIGFIALLGILVDDKQDKLYSFHIWQAFFLNLFIALVAVVAYVFWLPGYILSLDVYLRTNFFLAMTVIPISAVVFLLAVLGIIAARGVKFKILLLSFFANRITKSTGE